MCTNKVRNKLAKEKETQNIKQIARETKSLVIGNCGKLRAGGTDQVGESDDSG